MMDTAKQQILQSLIFFPDNLSTLPRDSLPPAASIGTSPGQPFLRWENISLFILGSSSSTNDPLSVQRRESRES